MHRGGGKLHSALQTQMFLLNAQQSVLFKRKLAVEAFHWPIPLRLCL